MRHVVILLIAGCGRIGFESRGVGSASGSNEAGAGGDAKLGDGNSSDADARVCPYLPACTSPMVTCCISGASSCTQPNQCGGNVIPCDIDPPFTPCGSTQGCCLEPDGGLGCIGPPAPC